MSLLLLQLPPHPTCLTRHSSFHHLLQFLCLCCELCSSVTQPQPVNSSLHNYSLQQLDLFSIIGNLRTPILNMLRWVQFQSAILCDCALLTEVCCFTQTCRKGCSASCCRSAQASYRAPASSEVIPALYTEQNPLEERP